MKINNVEEMVGGICYNIYWRMIEFNKCVDEQYPGLEYEFRWDLDLGWIIC